MAKCWSDFLLPWIFTLCAVGRGAGGDPSSGGGGDACGSTFTAFEASAARLGPFEQAAEFATVQPDAVGFAPIDDDATAWSVADLIHQIPSVRTPHVVTRPRRELGRVAEYGQGEQIGLEDVFHRVLA
jgi:hypothetical protein